MRPGVLAWWLARLCFGPYRAPMRDYANGAVKAPTPARRSVAWAVAIALLVNIVTIMPLMLGMAAADDTKMTTICSVHGLIDKGRVDHSSVDHSQCLVCSGGIGAAMRMADIAPFGLVLVATIPVRELPTPFPPRGVRTAYISRAPPIRA